MSIPSWWCRRGVALCDMSRAFRKHFNLDLEYGLQCGTNLQLKNQTQRARENIVSYGGASLTRQ